MKLFGIIESEDLSLPHARHQSPSSAKAYNRAKLFAGVASSTLTFLLLWAILLTGISRRLDARAHEAIANSYGALILFALGVVVLQSLVTLPIGFYSGFILEHRYKLSNQSPGRWAWEHAKGTLVSAPIALGVLAVLYYCLTAYGSLWWLPVACVFALLSLVLARLAPVLIMPLFYTFTPIPEGSLKERILRLCADAGLYVAGIFSFNLSKNTRKANAGFAGIGKSKRIILGDTLVREFSEAEIATVFAHELGHYRYRHIAVGVAAGTVSTFLGLFVAAELYGWSAAFFGYHSVTDLAALPLLACWLMLFGLVTAPLGNMLSRRHERQADAYAVATTRDGEAFVSALRKLATMNLADPEPHPVVEFLFYSHPPIAKRIRAIEMAGVA